MFNIRHVVNTFCSLWALDTTAERNTGNMEKRLWCVGLTVPSPRHASRPMRKTQRNAMNSNTELCLSSATRFSHVDCSEVVAFKRWRCMTLSPARLMQPTALSPGFILNSFPKACVFTVNEMWSCVANVRMTSSEHRGSNQKHRLRRDSWYKMALRAIMRLQICEESFRAARGTIKEKKRKKKRNNIKFIMGIIWVWGDICARSDNESGETTTVTEIRCRWMES